MTMKKFFNRIFGVLNLELKSKEPEKTKSKDGERLTEWEKNFIWKQLQADGTITCPNCESAKMVEGPCGGLSQNIRCRKCGQGINFLILPCPKGKEDMHALDWCDNIGISESWIRKEEVHEEVQ
jgi:DNA-directed RNA polymerase subunit RPC12/RpoP